MTKIFEPGEGNRYDRPEEKAPEPPGGFIDSTVYVYRLEEDGNKGKLLRTENPFPEVVAPSVWGKRKKGARGMPTKYDWDKILPIALKMREKGVVYKEIAEELGVPYSSLYYKLIKIEKGQGGEKKMIDWKKTYPKVEKLLEQGMDKADIAGRLGIPYVELADKIALEEQKKYVKNKEQGQSMTIAGKQKDMKAADPAPAESITEKSIKNKVPRNERGHIIWERIWPDIAQMLEAGMKPREVAHMYGIDPELLRKKIERERANSGQRHNDIIAGLKEKWIQDVLDDMNLDTKTKLQMIKDLTGMWGVA